MHRLKILLLIIIYPALICAIRYVRPSSGSSAFTGRTPIYNTVSAAATAGATGDTIMVARGTYIDSAITLKSRMEVYGSCAGYERIPSQRWNPRPGLRKAILKDDHSKVSIIDVDSTNSRGFFANDSCVIDGFEIKNALIPTSSAGGDAARGAAISALYKHDVTYRNIYVHHCEAAWGSAIYGINSASSNSTELIEWCFVEACSAQCSASFEYDPVTGSKIIIRQCTIAKNKGAGYEIPDSDSDDCVNQSHDFYNCVADSSVNPRTSGCGPSFNEFNCQVWGHARCFYRDSWCDGTPWTEEDENCVTSWGLPDSSVMFGWYRGSWEANDWDTTRVVFKDYDNGDYRLKRDSPIRLIGRDGTSPSGKDPGFFPFIRRRMLTFHNLR